MSSNIIILFYSNHCRHSHHILQLLQQTSFYNNVKRINIDTGEYKIPRSITSVPALIIPGRQPLIGQNAFSWVETQIRQEQQQQKQAQHGQVQTPEPTKKMPEMKEGEAIFATHMEGVSVYTPELNSAFSDSYCGLNDAYKTLDQQASSMVHTFAPANIENMPKFDQHLQNQGGNYGDNTIKTDDFDRRLNEFKKNRNVGIKAPQNTMRQ
jgi:hypothetical protein